MNNSRIRAFLIGIACVFTFYSCGSVAKLQEMAVEQEASKAISEDLPGYKAEKFPMTGADPTTQYVKYDMIGKHLHGYYITTSGNKVDAIIKYQDPETLARANSALLIYEKAYGEGGWSEDELENQLIDTKLKSGLKAFFVGGQMYVPVEDRWDILVAEGAIRQLSRIVPNGSGGYTLGELIQKLDQNPVNTASMAFTFKDQMSTMVSDHTAMAEKIKNKEPGYKYGDLYDVVAMYNLWYNQQYPGKVSYIIND